MIFIGIAVAAILIAIIAAVALWASRYIKVGPDEVAVISGRRRMLEVDGERRKVGFRVVRNGGTFVWPVFEQVGKLSLHAISTDVVTNNAITVQGVPLIVSGVAIFKVASDDAGIIRAAERYLGRDEREIEADVQSVLEGSLRAICGNMTPEDIYKDRQTFQQRVAAESEPELAALGINLDTLTLREIRDAHGYLDALGRAQTAEVIKDARVGEANAKREAEIAEALADQEAKTAQANAEAQIANAERDRDVKKAQFEAETNRERATASQAGPRAEAIARQEVVDAEAELARRRVSVREEELRAELVAQAEAERQQTVLRAQGAAEAQQRQAEADRYAREQAAEAEKAQLVANADGKAADERNVGLAEAEAIKAKLEAEADGLEQKAVAMQKFTDATTRLELAKELIASLPEIVNASTAPLSHIDDIRIVDFGGGNGHNGNGTGGGGPVDRLLSVSPASLARVDETLKSTLGFGVKDLMPEHVRDVVLDEEPRPAAPRRRQAADPEISEDTAEKPEAE